MPSYSEILLNTDFCVRSERGTGMKSRFHKIEFRNMLKNSNLAVCSTRAFRQAAGRLFKGNRSFLGEIQGLRLGIFPIQAGLQ